MSKSNSRSGGIGFLGMLAIAFIVLKLCKVIDWSWWWVISPIWGPIVIILAMTLFAVVYKRWKAKDEKKHNAAGHNLQSWNNGGKSKWEQRLEEMKKVKNKA